MRYVRAIVLALGIGVASVAPAAFAAVEEGGHDLSLPTTSAVQAEPSNPGMIAGPEAPSQLVNEHETDRN